MAAKKNHYHHGNLRDELLKAGEAVLGETGVTGFSLRQVARKVGVSHSAPAHHFGDGNGLLAALATDGFRRFLIAMQQRQQTLDNHDAGELLIASALGYLDFARSSPALFRLMFSDERIANPPQELDEAGEAAFLHLVKDIERLREVSPFDDEQAMVDVMSTWSMCHGFAELLIAGRMRIVQAMNQEEQEAFFIRALQPFLVAVK